MIVFLQQQNYKFLNYTFMRATPEKRKQYAQRKSKSIINNSKSKALYSFPRSERFPQRMYRSVTDIRFYDVSLKKYDKKINFTTSKRTDFIKRDGVPGPTRYNTISDFRQKKEGIQFKGGRDQCKSNSIFQANENPAPNQYHPNQTKFKTIFYSLGKKINIRNKLAEEVPGPIYNIQSTMLDKNKHLSIYVKRNSTKICPARTCFSRKKTENIQSTMQKQPSNQQSQFITSKGGRNLGRTGPFPRQTKAKRLFQCDIKQTAPGPGYYKSFSEFIDGNVQVY